MSLLRVGCCVLRIGAFVPFTVLAAQDEIPQLAPPLPEIPPTPWEQFGWLMWLLLPFVVMTVGIIAAFLLRPRKPPVLSAPAAQARAALTALQARPEDGATLSQISQTLRRHLIATFWLHPGETTTTEFCAALARSEKVGPELSAAVSEFLKHCDERKFSPGPGTAMFGAASRALELVDLAEARRRMRAQTKHTPSA